MSDPAPNSPWKQPPGEGTGPTIHTDSRGNLVGRVPSRGEQDVFEWAANAYPSIPVFESLVLIVTCGQKTRLIPSPDTELVRMSDSCGQLSIVAGGMGL